MAAGFPAAAIQVMQAAVEDYRLTTPPDRSTPAELVDRIAEYLLGSGYRIAPDLGESEAA